MKNSISERARSIVGLSHFNAVNPVESVCRNLELDVPTDRQYVLRMLIKKPHQDFQIPWDQQWVKPLVDKAYHHQRTQIGVEQPFCYVTIRSGLVTSTTDDEWHTDGFSTQITHIPEQSYGWCNMYPTVNATIPIEFPKTFNPLIHNVHTFIQEYIAQNPDQLELSQPQEKEVFCFDPYVIHRRPDAIPDGLWRTFVRVSFTPIEIADDSNTPNPLCSIMPYDRVGVKDFRDKLVRYTF